MDTSKTTPNIEVCPASLGAMLELIRTWPIASNLVWHQALGSSVRRCLEKEPGLLLQRRPNSREREIDQELTLILLVIKKGELQMRL